MKNNLNSLNYQFLICFHRKIFYFMKQIKPKIQEFTKQNNNKEISVQCHNICGKLFLYQES